MMRWLPSIRVRESAMVGRSSMVESGVSWLDNRVALLIAMAAAACSRVSRSC